MTAGWPSKTSIPASVSSTIANNSGGHLNSYYDEARTRINHAQTKLGNLAAATDRQILQKIYAVERSMRISLSADTLRLQNTDTRPHGTRSTC